MFILALLVLLVLFSGAVRADIGSALGDLAGEDFGSRLSAIPRIQASGHPRAAVILDAALEGRLYRHRSGQPVVLVLADAPEQALDALSGDALGVLDTSAFQRVPMNNRLRKELRGARAGLRLSDPNATVRLEAARDLLSNPSLESTAMLRDAITHERDDAVFAAMQIGLASIDINSPDRERRLEAIAALDGSLRQEVRALLETVARGDGNPDAEVQASAAQVLERMHTRLSIYRQLSNLYFGISLGSVLLLAAVGLAITFGVMGVINMAHGEMVMLGAYTTYVVQQLMPQHLEWSLLVALPAAFLVAGSVGVGIERGVIRFLYGRPLETLLATFGVSLILQQAVRSIFSPLNRSVQTPAWMSGTLEINPALALTYNRLYIIAFSIAVLVALVLLLRHSRFGLEVRAVTQNRAMASAMGIRTGRVDALTFGLGSGIAGLAGVALSQLTNVGPNMGQAYIVDSFMVVVFGGVGNLLGTFLGAMTLGIANKFLEPVTGSVLAKILILVFIIVFIQRRPRGLFALSGRSVD